MKLNRFSLLLVNLLFAFGSRGQGTLVYDQQSSSDETPFPAGGGIIQQFAPLGQSFTPSLSGIGFVQLKLYDNNPANGLGAALYVNLRAGSITGSLLGVTDVVGLTNGFAGVVNFIFANQADLTPGTTYYLEPVVQSGDQWKIDVNEYNYPGGTTISQGSAIPGSDLWFREGIIVPEPSVVSLFSLAAGLFVWRRCKSRNTSRKPFHSRSRASLAPYSEAKATPQRDGERILDAGEAFCCGGMAGLANCIR